MIQCKEIIEQANDPNYQQEDLTPAGYEAAALKAQMDGFEIVVRKPDQLLLDLDSPMAVMRYWEMAAQMDVIVNSQQVSWPSKNAKVVDFPPDGEYTGYDRLHAVIQLNAEVTEIEAIALQAMLGSDPMREYLNLIRLRNGVEHPTRLFRPPARETK